MSLFKANQDAVLRNFLSSLRTSGFTRLDPGSGIIHVVSPVIEEITRTLTVAEDLYDQAQLSTAEGTALDRIASVVGLGRLVPVKAYSATQRFYIPGGLTWVGSGGSGTAVIAAGTYVFSPGNTNLRFITLEDAVFNPDSTEAIVAIEAISAGSAYKVGKDVLTAHSATSFTSTIWTTNQDSVDSGEDLETDENLRYRISRRIEDISSPTELGIRNRLLAIPGVRDVLIDSASRGPGTMIITVLSNLSPTSQAILTRVQLEAQRIAAAGVAIEVRAPRELPVRVFMVVESEADGQDIREAVKHLISLHIANLGIGEELEISDLIFEAYRAGAGDAAVIFLEIAGEVREIQNYKPASGSRLSLSEVRVERR